MVLASVLAAMFEKQSVSELDVGTIVRNIFKWNIIYVFPNTFTMKREL